MGKLTAKGIEHAGPGEHYDGDGLILIIGPTAHQAGTTDTA